MYLGHCRCMTGADKCLLPRNRVASVCDLWPKFHPSSTWYLLPRVELCGASAKPSRWMWCCSATTVETQTRSLHATLLFSSQCHYAVTTSHQGCPSKPAAGPQVPPPASGETARCGPRRWTSIRRAPSPPKRSNDKRFHPSFFFNKHSRLLTSRNSRKGVKPRQTRTQNDQRK